MQQNGHLLWNNCDVSPNCWHGDVTSLPLPLRLSWLPWQFVVNRHYYLLFFKGGGGKHGFTTTQGGKTMIRGRGSGLSVVTDSAYLTEPTWVCGQGRPQGGPWTGAATSFGQGVALVSTATPVLSIDPVKGNEGQTHDHEDETHSSETGSLGVKGEEETRRIYDHLFMTIYSWWYLSANKDFICLVSVFFFMLKVVFFITTTPELSSC